jgi:hypothetical protein
VTLGENERNMIKKWVLIEFEKHFKILAPKNKTLWNASTYTRRFSGVESSGI